jgi:hypothetical protein
VTLLIPELQEVAKGIHNRIHGAQSIKISLLVSVLAPGHQLLVRAGDGGWGGGDNPAETDTSKLFSVARLPMTRFFIMSAALVTSATEPVSNHDARGLPAPSRPNTKGLGWEGEVA